MPTVVAEFDKGAQCRGETCNQRIPGGHLRTGGGRRDRNRFGLWLGLWLWLWGGLWLWHR